MTAQARASQMMLIKMNELPPLAVEFSRYLGSKYGLCGEVYMTAFAVYAQLVEGLACTDDLYLADDEAREWFRSKLCR